MEVELTRTQRLKLALFGKVYLEERTRPTWSGYLPFYAFHCPKHGIVEDYPHGYYNPFKGGIPVKFKEVTSSLSCPLCAEELAQYFLSLSETIEVEEEPTIGVPVDSS